MTSEGHTAGPWHYERATSSIGGIPVVDQSGITVANVRQYPDRPEACEEHARIIAAAPQMLAALKAHQLWEKREKEGPLYPFGMKRDSEGGEAIWRAWWNDQLYLCDQSHRLTDAALAKIENGPKAEGGADV